MQSKDFELSITTQGPTYPPSEVMDEDGNFVVIGRLNMEDENGSLSQKWGAAIVSCNTITPRFGENALYNIKKASRFEKFA